MVGVLFEAAFISENHDAKSISQSPLGVGENGMGWNILSFLGSFLMPIPVIHHSKIAGGGYQHFEGSGDQLLGRIGGLSVTTKCVIWLIAQFLITHMVLSAIRAMNIFMHRVRTSKTQRVFEAAAKTVNHVPMICVLLLVMRMRVLHLTQGDPIKYGIPSMEIRVAAIACTLAIFLQVSSTCILSWYWVVQSTLTPLEFLSWIPVIGLGMR